MKFHYKIMIVKRIIPSLANFRDVGGRVTPLGYFPEGVIFRSGNLGKIKKEDLNLLYDQGVRHIIDLRSKNAKLRDPSPALEDQRFDVHEYLIKAGERLPIDRADTVTNYLEIFASKEELLAILKEIIWLGKGTLIHCSAGKDRTGVVCSILLAIAGCSIEEINEHYLLAYQDLDEHVAWLRTRYPNLTSAYYTPDITLGLEVAKRLKEIYQTRENYYAFLGLTENEISAIRDLLFQKK